MVEYALIIVLVVLAMWVAMAATGPVIGNVFSRTVYDLLGARSPDELAELPDAQQFWATVTWVAQQTPVEVPFPTQTLPPPTPIPTAGPSPTPTPITPTATFTNTPTPPPSPTPRDFAFVAPWHDSADDTRYWRLDSNFYMGSDDWYGSYYDNRALSGDPVLTGYNGQLDPDTRYRIDYNWGNGSPGGAIPDNNWGAIWRRAIYLAEDTTLSISVPVTNNGIRLWILGGDYGGSTNIRTGGPGDCSATGITSGGEGGTSGTWMVNDDGSAYADDCLILDRWRHGDSASIGNVQRTIAAGFYTLQLDFYEETGSAALTVNFESASSSARTNPDDSAVSAGGSPVDGVTSCKWGRPRNNNDPNSQDWMWEEYVDGDLPDYNRCHLELRGYVEVPASMTNPVLSFWDAWDFREGGMSAWLEYAEYIEADGGGLDRDALSWNRVNLHSGDSASYNWTYQSVDISSMIGRRVALRFVVQSTNVNLTRRWYVDSITIDEARRQTFGMNRLWTLDDAQQADDFITSGRWELNDEKTLGAGGMAWNDSPEQYYARFWQFRDNSVTNVDDLNLRMHTVEFNGFIDKSAAYSDTDLEGDRGAPMLSFYHSYELRTLAGLEIQYTTDDYSAGDAANWQVVPVHGQIVPRNLTTVPEPLLSMSYTEIPLDLIPEDRFRLRFALTVHNRASTYKGWWIDHIQLQRMGLPRFTDLPFHDTAENITDFDNWLSSGSWDRVEGGYGGTETDPGWAYTDSPLGYYSSNSDTAMALRYAIDMNLDTPENKYATTCNLGADCEIPRERAAEPMLSFWHWRYLDSGEAYHVEWRRADSESWQRLWSYNDRMTTEGDVYDSRTREQRAWERVEVDLREIMADPLFDNGDNDPYDDDILLRIRFVTSSSGNRDGITIDEIRIEDRADVETWHALWAGGETRDDPDGDRIEDRDGNSVTGDGVPYLDGVDNNRNLADSWYVGGEWSDITWESYDGVLSWHSSPAGQSSAPPVDGYRQYDDDYTLTQDETFNVLEMAKIIDLRGVDASDRPLLYFWTRYAIGDRNRMLVQISYEDADFLTDSGCGLGLNQCYEHRYGWSEWQDVWFKNPESGELWYDDETNYAWTRQQVDLSSYAQSGSRDGRRIRLRFVLDALDGSQGWDGWYIDGLQFDYYQPREYVIDQTIAGGSFFDAARNTANWVTEGIWGLSPDVYRGTGGGPIQLGTTAWERVMWDLSPCPGDSRFKTCAGDFLDSTPNSAYASTGGQRQLVLDINEDWGYDGPYGWWNEFAGRWQLTTSVVGTGLQPGNYTFITTSDDGVRLKYEIANGCAATNPPPAGWNIISNWTDHGRTIDIGTASFETGCSYRVTLEYYERSSKAVIIMSTGSNSFSFSDSPKQGSGPTFPDRHAIPYASSSLMLDGVFNLENATSPVINYYTQYWMEQARGRVEISTDGGFTWTSSGLTGAAATDIFAPGSTWQGTYYNGKALNYSGAGPSLVRSDGETLTASGFSWGGSPAPGIILEDQFSVSWTRTLQIPAGGRTLTFRTTGDDGVRLWLDYFPGCALDEDGNVIESGGPATQVNYAPPAPSCLLVDDWENQSGGQVSSTRYLGEGTYLLQMDMFENTGNATARLEITDGDFDNPDYGTWSQESNWMFMQHDLSAYAGFPQVGVRFRFDNLSEYEEEDGKGWWIVDITVIDP